MSLYSRIVMLTALVAAVCMLPAFVSALRPSVVTHHLNAAALNADHLKAYPAQFLQQRLDHFDPQSTTMWTQKYYVNADNWKAPSGPIFLYINGEGPVSGPPTNESEVGELARIHGGLVVTLEHRFYGQSQPMPDWSTASLKFLSSHQALADLAYFRDFIQSTYAPNQNNTWINVGGSYSGALSAWFRLKYPHLTAGAISSSGVINAILDFYNFDVQVGLSAGPECGSILKSITKYVETALFTNSTTNKAIKMRLSNGAEATYPATDGDFLYFVADAQSLGIQYGRKQYMCDMLINANTNGNIETVMSAFTDYVVNFFLGQGFGNYKGYSTVGTASTVITNEPDRPWWYQTCVEFGYFNTAPKTGAIRSQYLNLTYFKQHCADLFGIGIFPNTDATNEFYGSVNIKSSNIVFVNSWQDPWRWASAMQSPGETMPFVLINCLECAHCSDLHNPSPSDPASLQNGRKEIYSYVNSFINPSPASSGSSDSSVWKILFIVFVALFAVTAVSCVVVYRRLKEERARGSDRQTTSLLGRGY